MKIADIKIGKRRRKMRGDIEGLANSIDELGLLNPITVREDGVLIAGARRLAACRMLGWQDISANVVALSDLRAEIAEIDENLMRDDLTIMERAEHLARRKELYEQMHPDAPRGPGRPRLNAETVSAFTDDAAEKAGVNPRTVRQDIQIATSIPEDVRDTIRDTEFADSTRQLLALARLDEETQRAVALKLATGEAVSVTDARRQAKRDGVHLAPPMEGKYRLIYADPPWKYGDNLVPDNYGAAIMHYDSLTIADLCALPVGQIAEDNSVLFLWVTSPLLRDCFEVVRSWGFEYKASFVWDKIRHNMGHYNSVRHEFLLICTRGSCLPENGKLLDSVVSVERSATHSEKPEEFRRIIETMYPSATKIELFARKAADGWDAWGNAL